MTHQLRYCQINGDKWQTQRFPFESSTTISSNNIDNTNLKPNVQTILDFKYFIPSMKRVPIFVNELIFKKSNHFFCFTPLITPKIAPCLLLIIRPIIFDPSLASQHCIINAFESSKCNKNHRWPEQELNLGLSLFWNIHCMPQPINNWVLQVMRSQRN